MGCGDCCDIAKRVAKLEAQVNGQGVQCIDPKDEVRPACQTDEYRELAHKSALKSRDLARAQACVKELEADRAAIVKEGTERGKILGDIYTQLSAALRPYLGQRRSAATVEHLVQEAVDAINGLRSHVSELQEERAKLQEEQEQAAKRIRGLEFSLEVENLHAKDGWAFAQKTREALSAAMPNEPVGTLKIHEVASLAAKRIQDLEKQLAEAREVEPVEALLRQLWVRAKDQSSIVTIRRTPSGWVVRAGRLGDGSWSVDVENGTLQDALQALVESSRGRSF